jgi:hypothetical protein
MFRSGYWPTKLHFSDLFAAYSCWNKLFKIVHGTKIEMTITFATVTKKGIKGHLWRPVSGSGLRRPDHISQL